MMMLLNLSRRLIIGLIFYIIDEDNCTVYILRVLRGESNWEERLRNRGIYHDVDGNII